MKHSSTSMDKREAKQNVKRHVSFYAQIILSILSCIFIIVLLTTNGFGFSEPQPKASLNDYEWAEIQAIARKISDAPSNEEALLIAKQFNLCDSNGMLNPNNQKHFSLTNGSSASVFILGFRHDQLADKSGEAGITFCFTSPIYKSPFNIDPEMTSWQNSDLQQLLGSQGFYQLLPINAQVGTRLVNKATRSGTSEGEDLLETSAAERFFPLSATEYGWNEAEQTPMSTETKQDYQYQLFKDGYDWSFDSNPVWTRTVGNTEGHLSYVISSAGLLTMESQEKVFGIAPAFCF